MITWNVDPDIFQIGFARVRWYGLMFVIGFTIGYFIVKKICRLENKSFERLENILTYIVIGTTVGARLGHCLFYDPVYYLSNPFEILKIWEGGLASHGGAAGVLISIWLFSRRYPDFNLMWLLDRISVPTGLVGAFIRFGNLMNSEILGKKTDVAWSFVFQRVDQIPRHPVQIYESLSYFSLFLTSYFIYLKNPKRTPGFFFGLMFTWIFASRFFLEFFKENQESFENTLPINMGQMLSVPFVICGLFFIIRSFKTSETSENEPTEHKAASPTKPKAKRKKPKKKR